MIPLALLLIADDAPGYYFDKGSGAPASPGLAIMQDCPVEIERERVFLWLEPGGARVRVSYVFRNPTDTAVSLLLLLPSKGPGDGGEVKRWVGGAETPVSYIEMMDENWEFEIWASLFGPLELVLGYRIFPTTVAATPVSFPAGKPVQVSEEYYLGLAQWSVLWSSQDSCWRIRGIDHERTVLYSLSTVRFWGKGRVGDFTCIIHPGKMEPDWFRLQDKFVKKGESFVFSRKDFVPEKDIWIIYYQATEGLTETSSFLDFHKYGPGKAVDGDTATCWAEGVKGNGVGEWIFLS